MWPYLNAMLGYANQLPCYSLLYSIGSHIILSKIQIFLKDIAEHEPYEPCRAADK